MMKRFALAGNPNCGKTTLFNSLTGSTAHVGNWPGVTVDKRDGVYKKCAEPVAIIDLPGIYSLSPYTPEEVIARNYILDEKPDCVINIVDATNLERNLYLTTQILEMDVPVVIALNMMDAVEKAGDKIDAKELERRLGVPVVKISALKEQGLSELMDKAFNESLKERKGTTVLQDTALAHLIGDVKIALAGQKVANPLFHAIKLVEGDEIEVEMHKDTLTMVQEFKETFSDEIFGNDFEALVADGRYKYISKHFAPVLVRQSKEKFQMTRSDKADKVLTNRWAGIPIFLVILFLIFHLTFSENFLFLGSIFNLPDLETLGLLTEEGEPISYGVRWLACIYDGAIFSPGVIINNIWNDMLVGELFGWIQGLVEGSSMAGWAVGLINDGIIEGLAAVLSFLPPILVLFLFFSILEDSGYMARIAFILDRMFRRFGLSGRAFMPMIMGFGCSVPAMINTRTLADDKERTATVRVIPFFSCGAKLPILTAVAGAIVMSFGLGNADLITYSMYILGIVVAIVSVLLMRGTTLKGETPPFIMELPAYHAPQFKNLMIHLWDKTKHFIKKAFTIILASTIVIWFLTHFSFDWKFLENEEINESILAGLAKLLQPLFTPLGFGSQLGEFGWVFVVAVVAGLIAKENVIATFATLGACLMAVGGFDFGAIGGLDAINASDGIAAVQAMIIATNITIPALISFIAFNMTTIPCFAAVGTAKSELGNKKRFNWTLVFWLVASYITGAAVYTIGSWWWTLFIWLAVVAAITTVIVLYNKGKIKIKLPKKKVKKSNPSCCEGCSNCSLCDDATKINEKNDK
ncbi:MAG: ferrous iron transporter B [Clostridiales bacterium]|nr:ferrous iron transporter B [Clostridiales bacterium]